MSALVSLPVAGEEVAPHNWSLLGASFPPPGVQPGLEFSGHVESYFHVGCYITLTVGGLLFRGPVFKR